MGRAMHGHIAAKGYLRAWAEDGVVGVGWVNRQGPERLPPSQVAVRSGFYLDRDPDGAANDWFEREMGRVEHRALLVLREIEDGWPVEGRARATLSEFLGLQYLRSPAYRAWYTKAIAAASVNVQREKPHYTDDYLRAVELHLSADRERHRLMVQQLPVTATVVANMRWTLLRCGSPRLATSDHPLVPVGVGARRPVSAISSSGVIEIAEVGFAVSATLLLLLTWDDEYGPEQVLKMPHDAVRNHNTLVIAQADEQWFHHPSRRAEHAKGGNWPGIAQTLPGARGVTPFKTRRHDAVRQVTLDLLETEGPERFGVRLVDWPSVRRAA